MADQNNLQIRRERILHHYIDALERGDIDTLLDTLRAAERDPILEWMILEVNDAYRDEQQQASNLMASSNHKEDEMIEVPNYPMPNQRIHQGYALSLVAATIAVLLFTAGLIYTSYWQNISTNVWFQMEEDNKATFLRYNEDVWNKGNVAALGEFLTPDHVRHDNGMDITGHDVLAQIVTGFRTAFPDLHFNIVSIAAVSDEVWAYSVGGGTHTGPMVLPDGTSIPASGNSADVRAMIRSRFEDGKIAEMWVEYDNLTPFQQIGVVPDVSSLATEAANKAIIQHLFDEAMNGSNLEGVLEIIDEVYAPRFRWHRPNTASFISYDIASWKKDWFTEALAKGFPDHQFVMESLTAEGDKVVLHYSFTATREQLVYSPMGRVIPATGDEIAWEGMIIYRLEEGKIMEEWWYWDNPVIERIDLGAS